MARSANRHGGGAATNRNGLWFEQETDLATALRQDAPYVAVRAVQKGEWDILSGQKRVGSIYQKSRFHTSFLRQQGIRWQDYFPSKKPQPDSVLVNYNSNTVFLVEKKYQSVSGSTDEKLLACDFKARQYRKVCAEADFFVRYIYLFNDWFRQDGQGYPDYRDYIQAVGCEYFFNTIPLAVLGLSQQQLA